MGFMESITIFGVLVLSLFYLISHYFYSYWRIKGVPHDPPSFPFGNAKGIGTIYTFTEIVQKAYFKFKKEYPFYGIYLLVRPAAVITDLDLIKNILIKDFNNFSSRDVFYNLKDDPLTGHMFGVDGTQWRYLRTKLSPTFSSGKMKFMFPTMVKVGYDLEETISRFVEIDPVVEIKDILARFTTDVIGTCAFGIECNSLKDPHAEFRRKGAAMFPQQRNGPIKEAFIQNYPKLARSLRMKWVPDDVSDFFLRVVRETVEHREKNNIHRNDFMDLMITIKNNTEESSISLEEIAAQAFLFFLAGFETSSTTMGFCLYELAQNQEIQDKLRAEVNEVFHKYDGKLTYEAINEMSYMDQVINETMRKYHALPVLFRMAIRDYVVPGTNKFVIEKNTRVLIPCHAIHHDPEYYPNPEIFDPDRFSAEESKRRHPFTFLPFGEGPRKCIGIRFGQMQVRIGLSFLLRKFKFGVCYATEIPLIFRKNGFIPFPENGIRLKVETCNV